MTKKEISLGFEAWQPTAQNLRLLLKLNGAGPLGHWGKHLVLALWQLAGTRDLRELHTDQVAVTLINKLCL